MVAVELLRKVPYFADLDNDSFEAVRRAVFQKQIERGEIIIYEGEPATALYFVGAGVVKVFKTSPEGKEQIISVVRPGELFNDISVFDGGPSPAGAQALSAVDLYGIRKEDIADILKQHPQTALSFIRMIAKRVRQLLELVEDLSFRRVLSRVARILLEYSADRSEPRHRLTQQDIAAMAGTAREVVGRSLKNLEELKLIRMESRRVVIRDRQAMQKLAMQMSET